MVPGEFRLNLTAIIPTRNRPEQVCRLVKDLREWNCEVIVVDDYSQMSVVVEGAKVVRNPRRLGGSESWNVGGKQAKSDWLFLIADDLVPSPGLRAFIENLLPKLKMRDVVGFRIVGFNRMGSRTVKLPYRDSTVARVLNILFGTDTSPHTGPSRFTTGAMIFHSKFFASLGGFDSRTYAGNGFREESDLQLRARQKGGRLLYIEDPFFYHLNVTGGYQKGRSENELYFMRNQTIFALKTARLSSLPMIAGYGAYLLAYGLPMCTIVRGIAEGAAKMIRDKSLSTTPKDISETREDETFD